MEPVLQRFGDVTIQRVEKPKPKPPPTPPKETNTIEQQNEEDKAESSKEETQGLKRNLEELEETCSKKLKNDVTITEKPKPRTLSFSEEEDLSEYDTESEFNSEDELDLDINAFKKEDLNQKLCSSDTDNSNTNTAFLEKLVEEPFLNSTSNPPTIKSEPGDADDYEYDIKEKLKEMGEISFETVKKGDNKPKKEEPVDENEVTVTPARKSTEEEVIVERKGSNMRRNIREVMDEAKLDESTLAAQRQEMERLRRVQEQQRLIREVQRQVAQERMQNKVISLLQGNAAASKPGTSGTRIGSTVLVKLPNGETKPMTRVTKRPFELLRINKGGPAMGVPKPPRSFLSIKKPPEQQGQLTPSVSIAPVMKKPTPPMSRPPSDSDSDEYHKPQPHPKRKSKSAAPATIDLSSDDDCIVVSEGEGDPGPDDHDDDPTNSGMHTNDEFNQPDEQGRVVINIGHPEGEPDIYVASQIARIIKPHQIGGVRFLYDNVIESIRRFDNAPGFGCILAHSMGLGKTLQIVCFSDIILRNTSAKTILCIMPINTLQNWLAEYNMWLPTADAAPNSPLHAYGEVRARNFNLYVLNDSHKTLAARAKVVHEWRTSGGVLLIGYEQFRLLSLRKQPKSRRKINAADPRDDDKNKRLFDEVHEALVKPGPDLVICDEGHRIKNSHASISQALKQMRTKRRIVLTGYPLQNNLMEYWCMVDFVRPNYLGTKTEFCNMFERPIQNGQCIDSTESDIKLMRYRAHVLHSLLVGFVQRRSHFVLQTALPQKEEYVLLVRMTEFQRTLYNTFMNEVVRAQAVPNPLKAFAVCCKIWNHPDVLYNFLKKRARGEAVDIDLEEVTSSSTTNITSDVGKPKRTPKKSTPKGKKPGKPAASITPYTSTTDTSTPVQNPIRTSIPPFNTLTSAVSASQACNFSAGGSSNSTQNSFGPQFSIPPPPPFPQQNSSSDGKSTISNSSTTFSQSIPSTLFEKSKDGSVSFQQNAFSQQSTNSADSISFTKSSTSYSNQGQSSNFSQSSHSTSFSRNNQFDNFSPQNELESSSNFSSSSYPNYWGQDSNFGQSNDYYNNSYRQNDVFDNGSMDGAQQWMKKDDEVKMFSSLNLKNETGGENKPKIKIISDIKIEPPYLNATAIKNDGKKINILSDIKLETKKEEMDEDKSYPKFPMESLKPEMKPPLVNDDDMKAVAECGQSKYFARDDGQDGIPYDWAIELLQDYVPGCIENSAKMEVLFCIIRESIALGDRLLLFSQSLITLDLIEQFLQMNVVPGDTQKWAKNTNYYRLDGSTSALEREKLINEFNSNPNIHLFLVSTRAGSLGINLVGANRVVVLDASWNPCHDTQAVCRVYRYGQRKPCFVYRIVMDSCLEKKIYDRQINKQGMADRVVDECNPDAHLTMKDVSTLCWDDIEPIEEKDWSYVKDKYIDVVLQKVLVECGTRFSKQPFQHESLLVDRKEKQLSIQEKRLAKKGYEREKNAARQPSYGLAGAARNRPVASVRPMQQGGERPSRWIPAEHWRLQGMTAQEMTLPLDVVIPTNQPDKGNIVLKAGQKVLVLKSPKGVYMQLENGKIVAIKTAIKVRGKAEDNEANKQLIKSPYPNIMKNNPGLPMLPQKRMVRPFAPGIAKLNMRSVRQAVPNLVSRIQSATRKVQMARGKPYHVGTEIAKVLNHGKGELDVHNMGATDEEHANAIARGLMRNSQLLEDMERRNQIDELNLERYRMQAKVSEAIRGGSKMSSVRAQISPQTSLIKNFRQKMQGKPAQGSTIQQLEQSTSAILTEAKQRIQVHDDIADSITNSYPDDDKLEQEGDLNSEHLESEDTSDLELTEQDLQQDYTEIDNPNDPEASNPSTMTPSGAPIKTDMSAPDYGYNNYYGYNHMQPYAPPPPQGYQGYPPQPYDMMNYQQPQPPQYNYGMYPQGYPPQAPPYAPPPGAQPYDYTAPPPPMYAGYHQPYPQQYPPPPPPQGAYPPSGQPPPNYDYQYNSTQPPPPPHNTAAPPAAPYFPNT